MYFFYNPHPYIHINQKICVSLFSSVRTIDLTDEKKSNLVLMSALFPGLGQYNSGNKTKAYLFSITTALCIVGSIYSYNIANESYRDYSTSQYKNSESYTDYNNRMDQMYCFMGLGLATWIFNIYDAYKISNSLDDTNTGLKVAFVDKKIYFAYSKAY